MFEKKMKEIEILMLDPQSDEKLLAEETDCLLMGSTERKGFFCAIDFNSGYFEGK